MLFMKLKVSFNSLFNRSASMHLGREEADADNVERELKGLLLVVFGKKENNKKSFHLGVYTF